MSSRPVNPVVVVAGAIIDAGRLLLAQRSYPADLDGLWELPGGKVEAGETREGALIRELCEELNVDVRPGSALTVVVEPKPGFELIAIRAVITAGVARAVDHRAVRWVSAQELISLDAAGEIVPNDRAWIPELLADLELSAAASD